MRSKILAATFLALCLPTSDAMANWQYTKWGMTTDQVRTAVPSSVRSIEPPIQYSDDSEATLTAPYVAGKFEFEARFIFDKRTHLLSAVQLQALHQSDCELIRGTLENKYGKNLRQKSEIGAVWADETSGDVVRFGNIGGYGITCLVTYESGGASSAPGL